MGVENKRFQDKGKACVKAEAKVGPLGNPMASYVAAVYV